MAMKSEQPEIDLRTARVLGRGRHRHRVLRLPLAELRSATGLTQRKLAEATGIDQADLSRLERRTDFDNVELSSLRRYVEALGGKLELVAVLPKGHRITIAGAGAQDESG